ncbi:MAG: acetyl-CoA C-acyltransferase [Gordonia sp.]|jgi:acetyl-CoA acyltransferase|uniref:Thiolase family protein n=1 Tax=Gordonia rubripertincta TaxID=36822 RepID=A0ABT4MYM6_GORRU|nr:thiolase family protein [Gordonia rubripertincta]MBA4023594.1 acetyl-CoA C-acyltransferase [Gordonia sp. (in: high G+C Gram-positive bacteria)]MCZ4551156.1 thiolase family protein [Gordonia rubripertincta]
MRDAVIVDAVRSPVGKRGGGLSGLHPVDLSAQVLQALAARNNLDPARVDDVIWGCVSQVGEQAGCIGRYAVLAAGWPEEVPGFTVDRQCGSSQQAVHLAAAGVIAGHYDVAIAGGVESMSRVPMGAAKAEGAHGKPFGPMVRERYDNFAFNQGIGAEMIADEFGLSRTDLDQHALDSHEKAAAAIDEGRFVDQIAPITVTADDGTTTVVTTDEGIRRGGTIDKLAGLKTPFKEDGVISAGNASQISDGSAALLITTSELASVYGWTPIARVHAVSVVGADPITMLKGPIPATAKVLSRAGMSIDDIGTFEINEAFASVSLGWQRSTGADYSRLNPDGGAMALGHPLGGSGARLMTTMIHRMRADGIQYGLQSMCEGGGMANATILELC